MVLGFENTFAKCENSRCKMLKIKVLCTHSVRAVFVELCTPNSTPPNRFFLSFSADNRKKKILQVSHLQDSVSFFGGFCGAGGSRTLVQTRNPIAFYTLILRKILLPQRWSKETRPRPQPVEFRGRLQASRRYSRFDDTPYAFGYGNKPSAGYSFRCLLGRRN